ncbi:MAG: 2-succinyl-5-enolpyruvyl-6-hydroxy-3-cyclohexene-1-carboxylic-acid synthase [Deltaproteobacteria bacterium]|nr:2-succinyl-5-enolpyruvyl-6-hydroxy-3-cyclohexene-1-carboxylic-acid synthase [Deltaproteobacteria bacterium]
MENARRAGAVLRALVEAGVGPVYVAPGSRSTPLVLELLRRPELSPLLVLDERAAGYAAVGSARVGHLAAVITTSGTAVANLMPAIVEADIDEVPFVAVTADRPWHEMNTGANQTIRQGDLFSDRARAAIDVPASEVHEDVRRRIADVLLRVKGPRPGPVHLNVRFELPLEPEHEPPEPRALEAPPPAPELVPHAAALARLAHELEGAERGLVVVGALRLEDRADTSKLVESLGWPWTADITSGLPRGSDALLPASLLGLPRPDRVLWIGGRMTNPRVEEWLEGARVSKLTSTEARRDPNGLSMITVVGRLSASVDSILGSRIPPSAFPRTVARPIEPPATMNEPRVAMEVLAAARTGDVLVIGNSMPIRDADRFGARMAPGVLVVTNRGASGIDGMIGLTLGAAHASRRPTTALIGDQTLLHDLGSLATLVSSGLPIRIIVVNNGGGGIFSFLPVAARSGWPERWFAAPHAIDLSVVGRSLGLKTDRPVDLSSFVERLSESPTGPELIEIRARRDENLALHRALDRASS